MKNYRVYWQYSDRRGGNTVEVTASNWAHAVEQAVVGIDPARPLMGMRIQEVR